MDAILLSAGIGSRTKLNYPKQFMRLDGKPLFIHCLEVLRSVDSIGKIHVAVLLDHVGEFDRLIEQYEISNVQCIIGGKTRQESVYNALQYCHSYRVLIHESARPFINKYFVYNLIQNQSDAVAPYVDITSTVVDMSERYLDRNKVKMIQLPQVYKTSLLKEAHLKAKNNYNKYTDDSSLFYSETNKFPTLVKGLEENIKITTSLDVKIAEVIYEEACNNHRR